MDLFPILTHCNHNDTFEDCQGTVNYFMMLQEREFKCDLTRHNDVFIHFSSYDINSLDS